MTALVTVPGMGKRNYGSGRLYTKHDAWYGSWRTIDGKRTNRKIGLVRKGRNAGLTKKDAEAELRKMIITDSQRIPAGDDEPTVEELGVALLARLERDHKKLSHIETTRGHIRKHINRHLGDLAASQVTDDDVQQLVDRMRASLAPKTIRNVIGTLHSVMQIAAKAGNIERNPCESVELPPVPKSNVIHFLTLAELDRVLDATPGTDQEIADSFPIGTKYGGPQAVRDWWPTVRLLILTSAMTGMRLGELRGLRWSDLDWGAVKVRVRQGYVRGQFDLPKSRLSSRGIPTASRLVTELDEHHRSTAWNQDSDLVLAHPHTGRPLDRVRLNIHFKAALKRANVRPVRIHDLRHTFATTVAASGQVSLRTLQEWMGHEDIRTTQIYADYLPSDREAELLDAAFGGTMDASRDRPGNARTSPGTARKD